MYHPANPSVEESNAGFTDDNFFEYVEVQNISAGVVDLTGVKLTGGVEYNLSLIHISEPTRPYYIPYAVFCLKKKRDNN